MLKSLMIVTDEAAHGRQLADYLTDKGFAASVFSAAEPALEAAAEDLYALALVDILLPDMSGIEFCQQVRNRHPHHEMMILLMADFSPEAEQLKANRENLGFSDCLFKPVLPPDLHRRMVALLGLSTGETAAPAAVVKGSLGQTPFARLLQHHYTRKSTGLLQVERGQQKKIIYLREGYPIFVRSNLVKECLGRMLVDQGLISDEQCAESLRQVRQSGRLQGTVLIEMGLLTPHQLHAELRRQVTEKLLAIFAWSDGEFQFIPGKAFKKGITGIDLSPAALIYQGIHRHYSPGRLSQATAPFRKRYLLPAESPQYRFQDIGLNLRDEKIYRLCRGTLTFEQIVNRYPLAKTETEQLLAALLISEMLVGRETPLAAADPDDDELLSPEARNLRRQLLEDYSRMIQQDYFSLLGVTPDDSKARMRKLYFALAKQYHPDRFLQYGLSADLKTKLNELFQHIGDAYETLSSPSRCKIYQDKLQHPDRGKQPKVEDLLRAETAFQKGRHLLRAHHYAEAFKQLSFAYQVSPQEPEYMTPYAYALLKTDPQNPALREQARQILLQSAYLNSEQDLTHLYLGYLLKLEGRDKEAEKRFELALQCNPDCNEALRELRLSNLRRKTDPSARSKGLLGKVFRKPSG